MPVAVVPESLPKAMVERTVESRPHAPNEELEEWPREPRLVSGPKGKWFYDARGLFFRRIGKDGGGGYSYECQRFGPRAVYQGLTAEERKTITNARRRAREAAKRGEG